jgi:hypothetical protein
MAEERGSVCVRKCVGGNTEGWGMCVHGSVWVGILKQKSFNLLDTLYNCAEGNFYG